jgi:hypothetical protein
MKCPICGSHDFFVKDPEDAYETYEIAIKEGELSLCDPAEAGELQLVPDTETYCDKCSWHGKLQELKKMT